MFLLRKNDYMSKPKLSDISIKRNGEIYVTSVEDDPTLKPRPNDISTQSNGGLYDISVPNLHPCVTMPDYTCGLAQRILGGHEYTQGCLCIYT